MISPKKRFERAGSTEPGIQLTEVAAMKVLGETFSMVPEDFNVDTHQITENIEKFTENPEATEPKV